MYRKAIIPFIVFLGIMVFLAKGLTLKPGEVPSPFVGKPAPGFELPSLLAPGASVSESTLSGQPWLLNVWASWCIACQQEHPVITNLAEEIDIVGLNYKDTPLNARQWLEDHGNPYLVSGVDRSGDVGIDYGVYGVPETFVIDQSGRIRYKHIGPVSAEDASETLLPIIEQLRRNIN